MRAGSWGLTAVNIPGEANTLSAEDTARMAEDAGHRALKAEDVTTALRAIVSETPEARVLICGSLYLAGSVLRGGMS